MYTRSLTPTLRMVTLVVNLGAIEHAIQVSQAAQEDFCSNPFE